MGVGELLKEGWRIYQDNFFLLVLIVALSLIPATFLSFVPFIGAVFYLLGYIFMSLALLYALSQILENEPVEIEESYRIAWERFPSFLWVSLLYGVIIFIGFLLLIVPGIIFAVWYGFCFYVFIGEGKRGWESLKRSRELVRGWWWQVFWREFVIGVVNYGGVILVALFIAGIFALLLPGIGFTKGFFTGVHRFLSLLVIPPVQAGYFLLYRDLKNLKEERSA